MFSSIRWLFDLVWRFKKSGIIQLVRLAKFIKTFFKSTSTPKATSYDAPNDTAGQSTKDSQLFYQVAGASVPSNPLTSISKAASNPCGGQSTLHSASVGQSSRYNAQLQNTAGSELYTTVSRHTSPDLQQFLKQWSTTRTNISFTIYPISATNIEARKYPISDEAYLQNFCTKGQYQAAGKFENGYMPRLFTVYERQSAPTGWQRFIDPQGRVYYWNETSRTLTDIDLYYHELLEQVNLAINHTYSELYKLSEDISSTYYIPDDLQLALTMYKKGEKNVFGYYFASRQSCCLFWLGDSSDILNSTQVRDCKSKGEITHIRYFMEAEYWLHYKTFPDVQILPQSILDELKGLLLYAAFEKMHNVLTTIDLSAEEIQSSVQYIESLQESDTNSQHGPAFPYMIWTTGVLMNWFAHHKFYNFYGQKNVRWRRDQPLIETERSHHRATLLSIISFLLLSTPQRYAHSLRTILTTNRVFSESWKTFIKELHDEWQSLILIATVLLATNVAFLAIQSVDDVQAPNRSAAQILSYISTILAIGSTLLSQLMAKYHRVKGWESLDERISKNYYFFHLVGPELLAVAYSLPYLLMTYSILSFLGAFLFLSLATSDRLTRGLVVAVTGSIGAILFVCALRSHENDGERRRRKKFIAGLVEKLKGVWGR